MTRICDVLTEVNEKAVIGNELAILTLTEKNGFVRQSDRFKKRLARNDTAGYKVIRKDSFAFNPYLLWAGAIARNTVVDVGVVSPSYPTFVVNDGYDPGYVDRLLRSSMVVRTYDSIAFGSVPRRRRSSVENFLGLSLPASPPVAEQRRIALILDSADEIRAKRRAQISHLKMLPGSLFNETFDESVATCSRVPLGNIVKWSSGKFLPASLQRVGNFPVYGGNGETGMHDEYIYEEPKLIVGRVGAKCGAVHVTKPRSWVTDNALVATSLCDDIGIEYLAQALKLANLNQFAETSGQPSISASRISGVEIPVPSAATQAQYTQSLSGIRTERDRVARALEADEELFAALQYRAFRGEL